MMKVAAPPPSHAPCICLSAVCRRLADDCSWYRVRERGALDFVAAHEKCDRVLMETGWRPSLPSVSSPVPSNDEPMPLTEDKVHQDRLWLASGLTWLGLSAAANGLVYAQDMISSRADTDTDTHGDIDIDMTPTPPSLVSADHKTASPLVPSRLGFSRLSSSPGPFY